MNDGGTIRGTPLVGRTPSRHGTREEDREPQQNYSPELLYCLPVSMPGKAVSKVKEEVLLAPFSPLSPNTHIYWLQERGIQSLTEKIHIGE